MAASPAPSQPQMPSKASSTTAFKAPASPSHVVATQQWVSTLRSSLSQLAEKCGSLEEANLAAARVPNASAPIFLELSHRHEELMGSLRQILATPTLGQAADSNISNVGSDNGSSESFDAMHRMLLESLANTKQVSNGRAPEKPFRTLPGLPPQAPRPSAPKATTEVRLPSAAQAAADFEKRCQELLPTEPERPDMMASKPESAGIVPEFAQPAASSQGRADASSAPQHQNGWGLHPAHAAPAAATASPAPSDRNLRFHDVQVLQAPQAGNAASHAERWYAAHPPEQAFASTSSAPSAPPRPPPAATDGSQHPEMIASSQSGLRAGAQATPTAAPPLGVETDGFDPPRSDREAAGGDTVTVDRVDMIRNHAVALASSIGASLGSFTGGGASRGSSLAPSNIGTPARSTFGTPGLTAFPPMLSMGSVSAGAITGMTVPATAQAEATKPPANLPIAEQNAAGGVWSGGHQGIHPGSQPSAITMPPPSSTDHAISNVWARYHPSNNDGAAPSWFEPPAWHGSSAVPAPPMNTIPGSGLPWQGRPAPSPSPSSTLPNNATLPFPPGATWQQPGAPWQQPEGTWDAKGMPSPIPQYGGYR